MNDVQAKYAILSVLIFGLATVVGCDSGSDDRAHNSTPQAVDTHQEQSPTGSSIGQSSMEDESGDEARGEDSQSDENADHLRSSQRWTTVASGDEHSCGLQSDGTLWCWGNFRWLAGEDALHGIEIETPDGEPFQCGIAHYEQVIQRKEIDTPVQVLDNTGAAHWSDWVDVEARGTHTCGVRRDGSRWCWGRDESGETFGEIDDYFPVPVRVESGRISDREVQISENAGEIRYTKGPAEADEMMIELF